MATKSRRTARSTGGSGGRRPPGRPPAFARLPKARSTPSLLATAHRPRARAEELTAYWLPETAEEGYWPYRAYVTRVTHEVEPGVEDPQGALTVYFYLASDRAPAVDAPYRVSVDALAHAWLQYPSTAQLATPEAPYGFLFLSDAWAAAHGVDRMATTANGGKWPTSSAA